MGFDISQVMGLVWWLGLLATLATRQEIAFFIYFGIKKFQFEVFTPMAHLTALK